MNSKEKQLRSEIEEEAIALEEEGVGFLRGLEEKYNPTPTSTPTSTPTQLGSVLGCGAGKYLLKGYNPFDWSCHDCPNGKYSNKDKDKYSNECKTCPAGSYPVNKDKDGNRHHTTSGAVECKFCGYYNESVFDPTISPYELPRDYSVVVGDTQVGRGRYLDGNTCRECPENSTLNPGVRNISVDYSWRDTPFKLRGGRNVNDCICEKGYIKVTNEKGGWKCEKCDTDNDMHPNKPPEQNPDKCVKRGTKECPYLKFSRGVCNTNPCEDGYEATILPSTDNYVACERKGG